MHDMCLKTRFQARQRNLHTSSGLTWGASLEMLSMVGPNPTITMIG